MCKIAVIAGLNPDKVEQNWQFIEEMGGAMTKGNNDGLGYTAVGEDGKLFGERWFNNHDAFDVRPDVISNFVNKYKGFLKSKENKGYNKFGERLDNITAITLHTRMATSEKGLHNVHPFVDMEQDISVIHNGVISNVTKEDNIRSTCDSERILNQYISNDISSNPDNIQALIDSLKGYFACGIFTRDAEGRRVVDLFRTRAFLSAAYVSELDALVFTTDIGLVYKVCKELGFNVSEEFQVEENILLRLDAKTGEPLLTKSYTDTANVYQHNYHKGYPSYDKYNTNKHKSEAELKKTQAQRDIDKLVQREIEAANKVTKTYDPLNESEAAKDGYTHTVDNVWVKRKSFIN